MVLAIDVNKYGFVFTGSEYNSKVFAEDNMPLWKVVIKYFNGRKTVFKVYKRERTGQAWFYRPKFDGVITKKVELEWIMDAVGVTETTEKLSNGGVSEEGSKV